MNQSSDLFSGKCSQCGVKQCAIICRDCQPLDRNETISRFCYSCYNLTHDEMNIVHRKQTISYANLKNSTSPRRTSFDIDQQMKTVSSYKASPYRKELFQSNVISTPLNQKNNYSEYRTHPTNQTLTYQKNLTDSIERKIRESRKKEVITKLNELNSKLGGGQSKHSFFSNKPTKDNFCSNIKTPLTSSMFPSKDQVNVTNSFQKNSDFAKTHNNHENKNINHIIDNKAHQIDSETLKKLEEQKRNLKLQIEEIIKSINNEEKEFVEKETQQNQLNEEEVNRFEQLNEEIAKATEDYDAQVNSLTSNLHSMKGEYENKLQDFEKMLRNSSGTIEKLQESISEAKKKEQPRNQGRQKKDEILLTVSELKSEIAKKKEILEKFKQGVSLSSEKCMEVSQTLNKIMSSKDKIIEELLKDNVQKEQDVQKLHQIVDNFKQMFEELNLQKDSIVRDNERLGSELEKAREIIMEALEKAKESGDIEDNDPEQNGNNHNSNQ